MGPAVRPWAALGCCIRRPRHVLERLHLGMGFGTAQLNPGLEQGSGRQRMQAASGQVAGDKPVPTSGKAGAGPEPGVEAAPRNRRAGC